MKYIQIEETEGGFTYKSWDVYELRNQDNQNRNDLSYEASSKIAFFAMVGILIVVIVCIILY
jgi:hypothetical protein